MQSDKNLCLNIGIKISSKTISQVFSCLYRKSAARSWAQEFGLTILAHIKGEDIAEKVKTGLML